MGECASDYRQILSMVKSICAELHLSELIFHQFIQQSVKATQRVAESTLYTPNVNLVFLNEISTNLSLRRRGVNVLKQDKESVLIRQYQLLRSLTQ